MYVQPAGVSIFRTKTAEIAVAVCAIGIAACTRFLRCMVRDIIPEIPNCTGSASDSCINSNTMSTNMTPEFNVWDAADASASVRSISIFDVSVN